MPAPPTPAPLRRALLHVALLLPCAAAAGGCSAVGADRRISFSTVQLLNPGVDGAWILAEYPMARVVARRPDGSLERLEYRVDDPQGRGRDLVLWFDEFGVLARKQYSGPIVRPLDPDADAGRGVTAKPRNQ